MKNIWLIPVVFLIAVYGGLVVHGYNGNGRQPEWGDFRIIRNAANGVRYGIQVKEPFLYWMVWSDPRLTTYSTAVDALYAMNCLYIARLDEWRSRFYEWEPVK